MKKNSTLLILMMTLGLGLRSQVVTNSADNESSVKYPGGAISFDLGSSTLGFSYLYYGDSSNYRSGYFGGLNFSAKNNSGIANLFSKGDLAPEGKGKLVIGHAWTWGRTDVADAFDQLNLRLNKEDSLFNTRLKKNMDSLLKSQVRQAEKYQLAKDKIVNKVGKKSPKKLVEAIDALAEEDSLLAPVLLVLKKETEWAYKTHRQKMSGLREQQKILADSMTNRNVWLHRFSLYAEGGLSALSFKQYKLVDSSNLSNNFSDQNFQGGDFKLGMNYQLGGTLLVGGSLGFRNYHTFSLMSDKEYSLKSSLSSTSQQQSTEKKFTAYSGTFDRVDQTYFLFDIVYFRQLDKKTILALNPYFRYWVSYDLRKYPDVKDLGLSLFFFKPNTGKFSGGIYVELPDMDNNLAKLADEPNLRAPKNRLSFGIVTKFNLGSLPGYSN